MTAWLALLGCVEGHPRADWAAGESVAARTYLDDDGLPVYLCSPPTDDSYIFTLPFHVSMAWMDWNNFNILIDAMTWIQPLVGVSHDTSRWREDGTPFEYETFVASMKLSAYDVEHPVQVQGEQTFSPDDPYGGVPAVYVRGYLNWDGEYDFVMTGRDYWFNPSTYCLGRIRHQRVQGSYTYWPDPETPGAEYLVPFPVTYIFDIQANTPPESGPLPVHPYSSAPAEDIHFLYARDIGRFYWDYADESTAEDLWTAEALPVEEDE
jgi:hypothetical protein